MHNNKKRATTALRNAMTRSGKHIDNGDVAKAMGALMSGAYTAGQWLNGTHPRACKVCAGTGADPSAQNCVACQGTGLEAGTA